MPVAGTCVSPRRQNAPRWTRICSQRNGRTRKPSCRAWPTGAYVWRISLEHRGLLHPGGDNGEERWRGEGVGSSETPALAQPLPALSRRGFHGGRVWQGGTISRQITTVLSAMRPIFSTSEPPPERTAARVGSGTGRPRPPGLFSLPSQPSHSRLSCLNQRPAYTQ